MRTANTRPGYHQRSGVYRPLIAAWLYFLGMVVLPSVHLGFHRNDHDHSAGGLHFHPVSGDRHSASADAHRHLNEGAVDPAAAAELASTLAEQSRVQLRLAVDLKTHGACFTGSFAPADSHQQSPAPPDHGSGSLAHFSCSYLASQDALPQLAVALHVGTAPRYFASQHTPSSRLFGSLKARAPPVIQAS